MHLALQYYLIHLKFSCIHRLIKMPNSRCSKVRIINYLTIFGLVVVFHSHFGWAKEHKPIVIKVECGDILADAMAEAKDLAKAGGNVRVVLDPCIYREQLLIKNLRTTGSIEIRARVNRTAIISGSDVFTGWAFKDGVWSTIWPYDFGLQWPSGWPARLPQDEVLKRVETFFVDGIRLSQVASFDELIDRSFFIDEFQNKVFIKTDMDLHEHLVEGTVRRRPIELVRTNNITLHGLVEQHGASRVNNSGAVRIDGGFNILLEDMIIRDNSGIGLNVLATRSITTRRVQFIDNGYNGYAAWKVKNLVSEYDTVRGSNWRGFPFGYVGWSVAGLKHLKIHNAFYRHLTAVDNLTRGFWLDYDIKNVVIENTTISDNSTAGMFLEKIQGPLLLSKVSVRNNIDRGITVSASQNITIKNSNIGNNEDNQIHFTGGRNVKVKDFETGEEIVLNTDNWTVVDSNFSAVSDQVIVAIRSDLGPTNLFARNNVCTTDNPKDAADSLICDDGL